MRSQKLAFRDILDQSAVFRLLPTEARGMLAASATVERFRHRTLLAARGEPLKRVRYVIEGRIEMTLTTAEGQSAMLPINAGTWSGLTGGLSLKPLQHELWSSKAASYHSMPAALVRSALMRSPSALMQIIEHNGQSIRTLILWTLGAVLNSPEKRLAQLLAWASCTPTGADEPDTVAMTQEQIGQLGFGTRQRVSQLLGSLQQRGFIEVRKGTVLIRSREPLIDFAFGAAD